MLRMQTGKCNCAQCQFVFKAQLYANTGKKIVSESSDNERFGSAAEAFVAMDAKATLRLTTHHEHSWQ